MENASTRQRLQAHRYPRSPSRAIASRSWFLYRPITAPHLFQIVELSNFRAEQMHYDIANIDQNPIAIGQTFNTRLVAGLFAGSHNAISDRSNVSVGTSRRDNHAIGDRGFTCKLNRNYLFGLGIIKALQDQRGQLSIVRTGRRCRMRKRFWVRFRPGCRYQCRLSPVGGNARRRNPHLTRCYFIAPFSIIDVTNLPCQPLF